MHCLEEDVMAADYVVEGGSGDLLFCEVATVLLGGSVICLWRWQRHIS